MDQQITNLNDIRRAAEFAAEKGREPAANPYPHGSHSRQVWAHFYTAHVAELELIEQ
jgi:hypothetical protein